MSKLDIQIKRAYDAPTSDDGYRVLVDRLWLIDFGHVVLRKKTYLTTSG